jgi:hypothetical protein
VATSATTVTFVLGIGILRCDVNLGYALLFVYHPNIGKPTALRHADEP